MANLNPSGNNLEKVKQLINRPFLETINFYDSGTIIGQNKRFKKVMGEIPLPATKRAVGFNIYGLQAINKASIIAVYDEQNEESLFQELGNVVASKIVSELVQDLGEIPVMTPPIDLGSTQVRRLLEASEIALSRRLIHCWGSTEVPFEVYFLTSESDANDSEYGGHA